MFRRTIQIFAIAIIALAPRTTLAAPVVIDFDGLSDLDSVVGQFAGVTFSGASVLTSGISLNEFEFPTHSGLNVVFDDGGPMRVDFASHVANVGGYFTYSSPFTLAAYDSGDTLLNSVASSFFSNLALSGDVGSSSNEFVSLAGAGIAYVLLIGDGLGGSFTLDDFTYDDGRAVPEPVTLSLLLCGGLGAAWRAKRAK